LIRLSCQYRSQKGRIRCRTHQTSYSKSGK